jgi:hypothetical protein
MWMAAIFCGHLCLCWPPAVNLKLVQTKGHDKLGVGITQESHKVSWYKFSVGGQGPSKHRVGKAEQKDKAEGLEKNHVSKSMSVGSGRNIRDDITSYVREGKAEPEDKTHA